MKLLLILQAEWMKTKRSSVRLLIFVSSILYSLIFLLYYYSRRGNSGIEASIYEIFFQLGSIGLPLLIGLLAGQLCELESFGGNFNRMLLSDDSKIRIFIGKLVFLMLLIAFIVFGATFLLLIGMNSVLQIHTIHTTLFLKGAWFAFLGAMFLFPAHLVLSLRFGQGASIGVGTAGFLIATMIGTTSLGDEVWQFFPWAWSARLSWCPIILMPNVTERLQGMGDGIYQVYASKEILPIICFFIIMIGSIIWFYHWEGSHNQES